jgi:tetratricopeptide (TPR) repeat protein
LKRNDIRALADEAYSILDESDAKYDVAVHRAMQVLQNAPKDVDSYLLLAEIAEEKGRFDQALNWVNQGLELNPDNEALSLKKAALLLDGFEDVDEAFPILCSLKDRFSKNSIAELKELYDDELLLDVYLLLTDCFRLREDYTQAFDNALVAKHIVPDDESALLAVATAHFELGDYNKALSLIEPVDKRQETSDFFWLKAQIKCAMGIFNDADDAFAQANKIDRTRYHRPIRMTQSYFFDAFEQASLALPREIRDFMNSAAIEIKEIVPLDWVKESQGSLSPLALIYAPQGQRTLFLFQKNIENYALKKNEVRDLIASALLHELGKLMLL